MPIYSFKCDNCGSKRDKFFTVSDSHKAVCLECGNEMKKDYQAMIPAYHDVPVDSVDTDLTGDPIVYHTRGQLKEIAKKHHCEVV